MPDTKITSARIREHLRRMWAMYLAGAVLVLFLNHLVFTVTRPGFSDDETLKIMILNADVQIDEEALLRETEHLGFRTVECVPLAAAHGDPTGEMLLMVQLTGGFGDIYISDDGGLELLLSRDACQNGVIRGEGLHIAAMKNSTTPERALSALPILAELIRE